MGVGVEQLADGPEVSRLGRTYLSMDSQSHVVAAARRQRADAAQNREAILAAALAALTESGDVSLNAIAKRAGIANSSTPPTNCWPTTNPATRCANGWPASLSTP